MPSATRLLTLAAFLGILSAQDSPFAGPVSGVTFDAPTSSFRAIIGTLGSASLGPALLDGLKFGSLAPSNVHGIACQEDQCFVLSGVSAGEISKSPIPNLGIPTGASWSADGSMAVVYSSTGNWIQTIKGLPGAAELGPIVDTSALNGSLSSIAVDRQGSRIFVGIVGESGGVYALNESGLSRVAEVAQPLSLTFAEERNSFFVLDGGAKSIGELNLSTMSFESQPFADLEDPIACRFAYDATRRPVLYLAGRKDRAFLAYDVSTREVIAKIELDAEPSAINPLARGGFLLGDRSRDGEPLWGLSTTPELKLYFVPAPALNSQEGAQ